MADNLLWVLMTLLIGTICGITAHKLKFPSGALVGAMVGALIFNLFTGKAYLPIEIRLMCQVASGTLIGCQVTRKDIVGIKKIIIPAFLLILGMFILNLCTGFFLYEYGFDLTTALFSCVPGGVTDMALIADEMGADITYVSILQISRLIGVLLIYPPLLRWFFKKGWLVGAADCTVLENQTESNTNISVKEKFFRIISSALIGAVGGLLATALHVPAGGIIGSLLFVGLFNVITQKGCFPAKIRPVVRIGAGIFIGARMQLSPELLATCIVPIVIMLVSMISVSIATGYLMHVITGLDLGVCLFASSPASMQEMVLMAQELKVDAAIVAIMHMFRVIAVIVLFPIILNRFLI